jgi:hypothetical protein
MEQATAVSVAGLDRDARLIVVDETVMKPGILDDLERHGVANLTNDVVLDPIYLDLFHKKLRDVLAAIGTPSIALTDDGTVLASPELSAAARTALDIESAPRQPSSTPGTRAPTD